MVILQNLDSPSHESHVAYMSGLDNGDCPSTHPVGLMHLMYEVSLIIISRANNELILLIKITWDVDAFADRWTEPNWPFVYATG